MTLTPRNYQYDHIDAIIRKLIKDRCTVAQLPTGGGKTVEFAILVHRYIQKFDKSVLILVHRIELLEQAKRTLKRMFGIEAEVIMQGTRKVYESKVYIGMVESVNTRADKMELLNLGLLIFDECHIGNFIKMFSIFTEEKIIGFTATPLSASKKTPLIDYFQSISCGPSIKQLIAMGYLSQNITRCPKDVVDEHSFAIDRMTGDFNLQEMAAEYRNPKWVMNTVYYYAQFGFKKKTLVFNVNVEHSKEVTECFVYCGYNAKHIDGTTPYEERAKILQWFKETPDAILCNVGITNVGFDEPTVEMIVLNFATLSLPKFLQCCGRGSRVIDDLFIQRFQNEYPYPLKEKFRFNILDLGGNSLRHGDWNDDTDWETMFYYPTRPGRPGLAPVKTCPQCLGLVHAAVAQCKIETGNMIIEDGIEKPELCGYVFNRKKFEEDLQFAKMVTITKSITKEKIEHDNVGKQPYFTFFEMGRMFVDRILESGLYRMTEQQTETMFKEYVSRVEDWFYKTFPGQPYNKEWHYKKAKEHFYKTLKERKQHELQGARR